MLHLRKSVDARIHRLQSGSETDSIGVPVQIDWNQMIGPGLKLFSLPMDVVMKNNLALSYFIDYMTSISCQAYIFFYLNVEGWKVSAEQHLMSAFEAEEQQRQQEHLEESEKLSLVSVGGRESKDSKLENLREGAHSIYSDYLSENAKPRLRLDDSGQSAVTRLILKIRSQDPDPDWFSEVQECVYNKLQSDERFFDSFKKSMGYVKLLAELDLLKDPSTKAEEDDNVSIDEEFSIYDNASLNSYEEEDLLARQSRESSVGAAELGETGAANAANEELDTTLTNSSGDSGIGGSIKSHKRAESGSEYLRGQSLEPPPAPQRRGHARTDSQGGVSSTDVAAALSAAVTKVTMKSDNKSSKSFAVYSGLDPNEQLKVDITAERTLLLLFQSLSAQGRTARWPSGPSGAATPSSTPLTSSSVTSTPASGRSSCSPARRRSATRSATCWRGGGDCSTLICRRVRRRHK